METSTSTKPSGRLNPLNDYLFCKVMGEKGSEVQLLGFLNAVNYELNTELAFIVQWVPVSEIKTDMSYNRRDDQWTVK